MKRSSASARPYRQLRRHDTTIRLVCIDHLATEEIGRGVYKILSEQQDFDLILVVPARWRENFREIPPDPLAHGARYRLKILPPLFPGKPHRCLFGHLGNVLKETDPDVVYVNAEPENLLLTQVILIRMMHRLRFKIVFVTWRNINFRRFTGFPYKFPFLYGIAEYVGLHYGDYCFSFNETGREKLGALGFQKVEVISPAIDTKAFQCLDASVAKKALGIDGFSVGFFGRFVEEKGVGLLLEAVAGLEYPITLLLVGNGPARETWLERARLLEIGDRVIHKHSIQRKEMPLHLCACDVVVLPSYTTATWKEQFGRILVEAMACGVPVVGARSGEIPDVIGDAGLVFSEKNVPDLQGCLRQLIKNPSLKQQLSVLGRKRAEKKYSCEIVASAWSRVIRDLLNYTQDCQKP